MLAMHSISAVACGAMCKGVESWRGSRRAGRLSSLDARLDRCLCSGFYIEFASDGMK